MHHALQGNHHSKVQEAGFESWQAFVPNKQLAEAMALAEQIWPVYAVLAYHRLSSVLIRKNFIPWLCARVD